MYDLIMSDLFQFLIFKFDHSVLKLFTGFAIAALIDWKLTVINAINKATVPANAKTHQAIFIL